MIVHLSFSNILLGEYDQKRLLATKAVMDKPSAAHPRLPNPTWSGLGFSSSMPESSMRKQLAKEEVSAKQQHQLQVKYWVEEQNPSHFIRRSSALPLYMFIYPIFQIPLTIQLQTT